MNSRIKELMEQAGLHDFVIESMGIDEEMNKFAELIVEDSIGILIDYLEGIDQEQKTPSFIGMTTTIVRIREHFGVERCGH